MSKKKVRAYMKTKEFERNLKFLQEKLLPFQVDNRIIIDSKITERTYNENGVLVLPVEEVAKWVMLDRYRYDAAKRYIAEIDEILKTEVMNMLKNMWNLEGCIVEKMEKGTKLVLYFE